jgi:ribosome-associated protein
VEPLRVNGRLVLPAEELTVSFARSGGPGGQNVNKVASKAVLRFNLRTSKALGEIRRTRLLERLGPRLTQQGEIVVHASRFREQSRNLEDARERLAELLRGALAVPKARKPTRPTRGSQRRRLESKRRKSQRKQERRDLD